MRRREKTLMDSTSGAYLVDTEASTYLVDLDRWVIKRTPRTQNVDRSLALSRRRASDARRAE